MSSIMENAKLKAGMMLNNANKAIQNMSPENELNRKNYNRIVKGNNEAEFEVLRNKYGDDKVYLWIKENQDANR